MLLRWLVDQYLRDAAHNKLREVVTDITTPGRPATSSLAPERIHSKPESLPTASTTEEPPEFLPCHAAFIFALSIESGGLTDLLQGGETSRHSHGTERAGKLAGREVVIVEGGVGQKSAARATAETIKFYKPDWVISAGFAGGLDEKLRRGHILMADEVINASGDSISIRLPLDRSSLAGSKGLHIGRLLTVDSIIREPADRHALASQHNALACDMECFAVARVCRDQNIPFLAIRIISDAVDDALPPEIEHLLKQKSLAAQLGAAAGAIFKRLGAAKDLWKLREDALKASDRLAKFLVGIIEQLKAGQK